ncbi:group XIIA secretory phospholipase A2-like [Gigantopelta aegis]|uniref:group XIIA secretory phospholipase A2-like n=1 Tax=Gigantopelta aegis TaxID=1735272 RepID=UPI001B88BBC1|nr:group XIIA secretory phospholipase A2-like [Gigantopelta aegis]
MKATYYMDLFVSVYLINNFVACDAENNNKRDNWTSGFDNLLQGLSNVADLILDFTGEADGCRYRCKNGAQPSPNPRHTKSYNGCGSHGFMVDTSLVPDMTRCCNLHDICYDTCNKNKEKCDKTFYRCLEDSCHKMKRSLSKDIVKGCKATAGLMYTGTMALGCKSYKEAQKDACVCDRGKHLEF